MQNKDSKSENTELINITIENKKLHHNNENLHLIYENTVLNENNNHNQNIKLNAVHEVSSDHASIQKTIITPTRFTYPQRAISKNRGLNVLEYLRDRNLLHEQHSALCFDYDYCSH